MHKQRGELVDSIDPMRFFKKLQSITNKINAASKIEEIMLDLSEDICDLFACDRLTLYALSESRTQIEAKVKTGLRSFKNFSLPISEDSIAGYVALTRRSVNLNDVYDIAELRAVSPGLKFMSEVDRRTGYRTRQMLVAPLVAQDSGDLLGVVQLINNRSQQRFAPLIEDGLKDLCETLSKVFAQRMLPLLTVRLKYDPLVALGILSGPELSQAYRRARISGREMQSLLEEDYHLRPADIGAGLAAFFEVPYLPFSSAAGGPPPAYLKKFKRAYAEHNRWLLLSENEGRLQVVATDPARARATHVIEQSFPHQQTEYFVTTDREFRQYLDRFWGVEEGAVQEAEEVPAWSAAEQELVQKLRLAVSRAAAGIEPGMRLELREDLLRMVRRARDDGSLAGIRGHVTLEFFLDFP